MESCVPQIPLALVTPSLAQDRLGVSAHDHNRIRTRNRYTNALRSVLGECYVAATGRVRRPARPRCAGDTRPPPPLPRPRV